LCAAHRIESAILQHAAAASLHAARPNCRIDLVEKDCPPSACAMNRPPNLSAIAAGEGSLHVHDEFDSSNVFGPAKPQ